MPQIKNITLHSFSSEDPNFPAENLVQTQVTRKWKCEKIGEKSAFVILKFDKPYKITSIDIGNEFTAVVEVSVANSKQVPPKFEEFLLATSLMTLTEANNEWNKNRVKMYNKDIFNPVTVDKKWDLVKITCSQFFNNHKQFGLSFINFHTDEEVVSIDSPPKVSVLPPKVPVSPPKESKSAEKSQKIGKFRFRESSSDDEDKSTSPFAQWKNKKDNKPQASSSSKVTPKTDTKLSIKEQLKARLESENKRKRIDDDKKPKHDRNRVKGLFYESSDDEPNEKLQKKIEKDKELKSKEQQKSTSIRPTTSTSSPATSKFSSFIDNDEKKSSLDKGKRKVESQSTQKKKASPTKKDIKYKSFEKLLDGVVFVISGYQNPERGNLRQKALDMGAKYKADWDDTCTHLICAYSNTPKYNQVKGKGKIVSKKWIENCFIEQKAIPWRRCALDSNEKNKPESDDEILCEWNKPKDEQNESSSPAKKVDSDESDGDMLIIDRRVKTDEAKIVIEDSDEDADMVVVDKRSSSSSNNINAGDINESQMEEDDNNNKNNMDINSSQQASNDAYSDDSNSSIDIRNVDCRAFDGKTFYMNEDLSATDVIKLKDNIKHMLGAVTKNPQKADYIITRHGKKLPRNVKGEILKEIWVRECFDLQAFIPTTRYKV